MSYTPTTWVTGDTINATKLNKIENGIANAGSILICNCNYVSGDYILDKTAGEIYDALLAGTPVYIKYQYGTTSTFVGTLYLAPVIKIYNYNHTDIIRICASKPYAVGSLSSKDYVFSPAIIIYSASDIDDYPVFYTTVYVPSTYVTSGGTIE